MRHTSLIAAFAALLVAAPAAALAQNHACTAAPARLCHTASARSRHRQFAGTRFGHQIARYGRPYHIPRFSQAEAEAEVHTVYPYRTGIFAPWPDFYGTPYYPPY